MQFLFYWNPLMIGYISFHIIKRKFGDGPSGRFLAVLGYIVCAVLYFLFSIWILKQGSMNWENLVIYGPIILVSLYAYASKGNKSNI